MLNSVIFQPIDEDLYHSLSWKDIANIPQDMLNSSCNILWLLFQTNKTSFSDIIIKCHGDYKKYTIGNQGTLIIGELFQKAT